MNTASRMETTCEPMRIQCTESSMKLLEAAGGWTFEARGPMQVKGKGTMNTYWLTGRTQAA